MMIRAFQGLSPIDPDEPDDFSGMTDLLLDVSPSLQELITPFAVRRVATSSSLAPIFTGH
jgi:hypothetical protein